MKLGALLTELALKGIIAFEPNENGDENYVFTPKGNLLLSEGELDNNLLKHREWLEKNNLLALSILPIQNFRFPKYYVTENADVISLKRDHPLLLKPEANTTRPRVRLVGPDGANQGFPIAKLTCETFRGKRPKNHVIRHLDGNVFNNHISNLAYGTNKNNRNDAIIHGVGRKTKTELNNIPCQENAIMAEISRVVGSVCKVRKLNDFDFKYITSTGQVFSYVKESMNIKELKQQLSRDGYYVLDLKIKGIRKKFKIHRLVYEYYGKNVLSPAQVIAHLDGNKINNRIDNLAQVTQKENCFHTRKASGFKGKKLTLSDVIKIKRELKLKNMSKRTIAETFCVSVHTIYNILKGKVWKYV